MTDRSVEDELTPAWWHSHGYIAGRELDAGLWMVVAPMLYTYRVMVATPEAPTGEFYCYTDLKLAAKAFMEWDGGSMNPIEGWTRYHRSDDVL